MLLISFRYCRSCVSNSFLVDILKLVKYINLLNISIHYILTVGLEAKNEQFVVIRSFIVYRYIIF